VGCYHRRMGLFRACAAAALVVGCMACSLLLDTTGLATDGDHGPPDAAGESHSDASDLDVRASEDAAADGAVDGSVTDGSVTFSASFSAGASTSSTAPQCIAWESFRAKLTGTYSAVTVSGTQDVAGVTCEGSAANLLCHALHDATTITNLPCGGRSWSVGQCDGALELNADSAFCMCKKATYNVAPCYAGVEWGGVNTDNCPPPSQTANVTCRE
jgi:hypothetical protein